MLGESQRAAPLTDSQREADVAAKCLSITLNNSGKLLTRSQETAWLYGKPIPCLHIYYYLQVELHILLVIFKPIYVS